MTGPGGTPLPPHHRNVCLYVSGVRQEPAKYVHDTPKKFPDYTASYYVGYWERVKHFFEKAPENHGIEVGCLVTCTCHGGVAIVLELFDKPDEEDYPNMNMAKIWWVKLPHTNIDRTWMHTIARLHRYPNVAKLTEDLKNPPK